MTTPTAGPHDQDPTRERLSRDELYVAIANLYAMRSTCLRGHVGVVLVQDRRPVAAGYNGAPSGLHTCLDKGCEAIEWEEHHGRQDLLELYGCQRAVHAEANAIAWAARHGVSLRGAEMFATHAPCKSCAQLIVAAEIGRFVYWRDYRAARLDILDKACTKTEKFELTKRVEVQCSTAVGPEPGHHGWMP